MDSIFAHSSRRLACKLFATVSLGAFLTVWTAAGQSSPARDCHSCHVAVRPYAAGTSLTVDVLVGRKGMSADSELPLPVRLHLIVFDQRRRVVYESATAAQLARRTFEIPAGPGLYSVIAELRRESTVIASMGTQIRKP